MKTGITMRRLRFLVEPDGTPDGGSGESTEPDDSKGAEQPDEPLGEGGKKALVAERAARATAERELAALRQQIEDAGKSAEQKAADDLAKAKAQSEAADLRALRYEVAAEKGIDLKLAGRLTGATKAELEADAEVLKSLIPGAKPEPKPDPSQGGGSGTDKGASVSAGRDLWAEKHAKSKTT